jgi:hypothetical protein
MNILIEVAERVIANPYKVSQEDRDILEKWYFADKPHELPITSLEVAVWAFIKTNLSSHLERLGISYKHPLD